jgi:hypothetical protein
MRAQAGIAGRGLDHGAARLQQAVVLGLLDHGLADAVLDGAARVLRFELEEQLAGAGVDPGDFHQRGIADQRKQCSLRRMLHIASVKPTSRRG